MWIDNFSDLRTQKSINITNRQWFLGGELQLPVIARAQLSDRKVLIVDEPTSGTDRKLKNELMVNLKKYFDETIIFT